MADERIRRRDREAGDPETVLVALTARARTESLEVFRIVDRDGVVVRAFGLDRADADEAAVGLRDALEVISRMRAIPVRLRTPAEESAYGLLHGARDELAIALRRDRAALASLVSWLGTSRPPPDAVRLPVRLDVLRDGAWVEAARYPDGDAPSPS